MKNVCCLLLLGLYISYHLPSRQSCRKGSVEECIFEYIALHIECRFNKNSLCHCYFLVILPAGLYPTISKLMTDQFSLAEKHLINSTWINCSLCPMMREVTKRKSRNVSKRNPIHYLIGEKNVGGKWRKFWGGDEIFPRRIFPPIFYHPTKTFTRFFYFNRKRISIVVFHCKRFQ